GEQGAADAQGAEEGREQAPDARAPAGLQDEAPGLRGELDVPHPGRHPILAEGVVKAHARPLVVDREKEKGSETRASEPFLSALQAVLTLPGFEPEFEP